MAVDGFTLLLGSFSGSTDVATQVIVGNTLKPWFFATAILALLLIGLLVLMIFVAKRTHGFKELGASLKGKRMCLFFDDTRNVDVRAHIPSAGIIEDKDYGSYIVHEEGAYVDKKTRNIYMCYNTNQAMGASVKHFDAADKLSKILGDPKGLQTIALAMANGQLADEDFDALKTNINFSTLKSFSNTMLPHNITAKINMEVAKRLKSYGAGGGTSQIMWFFLVGMGLLAVLALILWMTMGGKGSGGATTIVTSGANLMNASGLVG